MNILEFYIYIAKGLPIFWVIPPLLIIAAILEKNN